MEENTNLTAEQQADRPEAFLDGWEEAPAPDRADAHRHPQGEEASADTGAQGGPSGDDTPREEGQPSAAPTWTVKHMDRTRTMGADEVTPELLQKGLDYDRIRSRYDEAKPVLEQLSRLAAREGMTLPDYAARLGRGQAAQDADRSRWDRPHPAPTQREGAPEQDREQQQTARIRADLAEFARAFPDAHQQAKTDRTAIPPCVWEQVNAGMTLTAAYARYAVEQARQAQAAADHRAQTERQNRANAARSTGSLRSAGSDARSTDPFLRGWEG